MNKVFLIGNLTRDPELTETASGVSVCHFSIAVNRPYSGEEKKTDFFNVTAWRGLADSVARYCAKGNKVAVTGSVQMRLWEDNDGNKHQAVDIIAQDVEFLTSKNRNNEDDDLTARRERIGDSIDSYESHRNSKRKPAQQSFYDDDDPGDIPF